MVPVPVSPCTRKPRNPVHGRSFVDLTSPCRKGRALVLPLPLSQSIDGGVWAFTGIFYVVATATVCSTIVGALPAPDSAGNNPCRGHRGGLGVWFFVLF